MTGVPGAGRRQRMRYRFDERMAKGTQSIFAALLAVFVALLLVVGIARAILVSLVEVDVERGSSTARQIFITFLELTDPGSMTQDIGSSPWVKLFTVIAYLATAQNGTTYVVVDTGRAASTEIQVTNPNGTLAVQDFFSGVDGEFDPPQGLNEC